MKNRPLYEEISKFIKTKKIIAIPLIILGLLGLILPIIPGTVFLVLALLLLFPKDGEKLIEKIKRLLGKKPSSFS